LGVPGGPFVIEGDEYDSAFFEKTPKFWRYRPEVAVLTSIEQDHIDIYADMEAYRAAFAGFVARLPETGLLVAFAGDPEVRQIASQARCKVCWYALQGDDCSEITPTWFAAPAPTQGEVQPFDLFIGGSACGRLLSPLAGRHNLRNTLAALALCAEAAKVPVDSLKRALPEFRGVRRRQQLRGVARGVRVYDDFAHHPSAVAGTLDAMRDRHPEGRLIAVFEPRSATASRRLHQDAYPSAFRPADLTLLAPVGRSEIASADRLDVAAVAQAIQAEGRQAEALDGVDSIIEHLETYARAGDTVVIMSNGAFGGIHDKLLAALTVQALRL
jgi:UDP-N-acetylmuramate: L-alanyl-gamma-D-glutamyl-meso-diaminopimelate ligase